MRVETAQFVGERQMIRRIEFWQRALWIGLAVVLAHAAPAHALITVEGRQSATFQWAPSSGPVTGYWVVLGEADGSNVTLYSTVVGRTSEIIEVPYGQVFTVGVIAFDVVGRGSPLSPMSEAIVFMAAPPPADDPPADDPPADDPPADDPPADEPPADDPPPAEDAIAASDFDGDGISDLLVRNWFRGDMEIWNMDGQGVANVASLPGAGFYATVVGNGDYDGDGTADVLLYDSRAKRVSLYFIDGNSLRESVVVDDGVGSTSKIVGSGDYDGDGISDVLIYRTDQNRLELWTMDGSGGFAPSTLPDDFADGAEIIASGDFDGDGMADILWRDPASGEVDIWGLTGDVALGSFEGAADSWEIIGAGDFDGDGRDDLLLREESNNFLAVRLSSRGVRDQISYERNATRAERQVVAMGDYDGDGRTDLVVFASRSGALWVWYMDGSSVARGQQIGGPPKYWDFAGVDQRVAGSR